MRETNVVISIMQTINLMFEKMDRNRQSDIQQFYENRAIESIFLNIVDCLTKWLRDYQGCHPMIVARMIQTYLDLHSLFENKDEYQVFCEKKSIILDFVDLSVLKMSQRIVTLHDSDNNAMTQVVFNSSKAIEKFRIDFLAVLHDQVLWHRKLSQFLLRRSEFVDNINILNSENQIDNNTQSENESDTNQFSYHNEINHTEIFLIRWIKLFSKYVGKELDSLTTQDIGAQFLDLVECITKFINIANQYKKFVTTQEKIVTWNKSLPPVRKICSIKFRNWIRNEIEPVFERVTGDLLEHETWDTEIVTNSTDLNVMNNLITTDPSMASVLAQQYAGIIVNRNNSV